VRGQAPGAARSQSTGRVGVASARGVALGRDEHVLAQGGQVLPAEGAAVGRRLAVLGPPNRPPGGGVEGGHGCSDAASVPAARTHHHGEPVARAERRRRVHGHLAAWRELEPEALEDQRKKRLDLELPEAHAEADP